METIISWITTVPKGTILLIAYCCSESSPGYGQKKSARPTLPSKLTLNLCIHLQKKNEGSFLDLSRLPMIIISHLKTE